VVKDYYKISYAGADTLYVPCIQLDLISKYIAPEKSRLKLNKMGGSEWAKTKARVREETGTLATELIELYAHRQRVAGFAFPPDDDLQRDFESRFPYDEPEDQLRCIEEIKADMATAVPMDRLLCGDWGSARRKWLSGGLQMCFGRKTGGFFGADHSSRQPALQYHGGNDLTAFPYGLKKCPASEGQRSSKKFYPV
jgi:hypothetical protein